jgi:16S rRNA (cytosine1402-N4)-methyltransferase
MTDDRSGHVPVLLPQVLDLLTPRPGEAAVDATLGLGGHASELIPRLAPGGRLIGLDLDPGQLEAAASELRPLAEQQAVGLTLHHANFRELGAILRERGLTGVDLLLADLGFASSQMAQPERGLSFQQPGPLDMRLDPTQGTPASELVNTLPERQLADLIFQYGEERLSRKIARKIVEQRQKQPIHDTGALAELIRRAYGPAGRKARIDPATRTFQALRIAVNGELAALESLLEAIPDLMNPGGRAALISFHSLEDRRVKHAMQSWAQQDRGQRLTRKPVTAEPDEVAANPRSRSAKLRAFRFA